MDPPQNPATSVLPYAVAFQSAFLIAPARRRRVPGYWVQDHRERFRATEKSSHPCRCKPSPRLPSIGRPRCCHESKLKQFQTLAAVRHHGFQVKRRSIARQCGGLTRLSGHRSPGYRWLLPSFARYGRPGQSRLPQPEPEDHQNSERSRTASSGDHPM
jgi:hypothetical protein